MDPGAGGGGGPAGLRRGLAGAPWDLYRDWLPLLAREPGRPRRGAPAGPWRRCPGASWRASPCPPRGSSCTWGRRATSTTPWSATPPWAPLPLHLAAGVGGGERGRGLGAFAGRSRLSRLTRLGRGAVVDHCAPRGCWTWGRTGWPVGCRCPLGETLRVDAGRLCYQTLLAGSEGGAGGGAGARRVTVVLGLDDNPKLGLQAGAPDGEATLNGQPLAEWLAGRGLAPEHLWPGARAGPSGLHPVGGQALRRRRR